MFLRKNDTKDAVDALYQIIIDGLKKQGVSENEIANLIDKYKFNEFYNRLY